MKLIYFEIKRLKAYLKKNELKNTINFLNELKNGKKSEKYEVCEAVGESGDISDADILEELLEDPDIDVRVSAANATPKRTTTNMIMKAAFLLVRHLNCLIEKYVVLLLTKLWLLV